MNFSSLPGGAIVGRQRETDQLKPGLGEAQSERGRLVMLVGERLVFGERVSSGSRATLKTLTAELTNRSIGRCVPTCVSPVMELSRMAALQLLERWLQRYFDSSKRLGSRITWMSVDGRILTSQSNSSQSSISNPIIERETQYIIRLWNH